MRTGRSIAIVFSLALVACTPGDITSTNVPGDNENTEPYNAITADEVVYVVGTEPFWDGAVRGSIFTLKWADEPEAQIWPVERFAGRGGLSFSGTLNKRNLIMAITPADCSDGMSNRGYPFAVTLGFGNGLIAGCGWTDSKPFYEADD